MNFRHGLVGLALLAALVAAGCGKGDGPTAPGDRPRTAIRAATPKDLLQTAHEAVMKDDMAVLPSLVNPAAAESFRALLEIMTTVSKTLKEVAATVEQKIGKDQAAKVTEESDGGMDSPVAKAVREDGSVDWNRVTITEEGDTAKYAIDGKTDEHTILRKIDRRWYLDFTDMTPEQMRQMVQETRPQMEKMVKAWRDLEAQVEAGAVTAENFDQKLLEMMVGMHEED